MTRRKHCLIELSFLEEYSQLVPTIGIPDEQSLEAFATWANIYSFICRSDLTFDCTLEEFSSKVKTDKVLFQLWKRNTGGECYIRFNNSKFNNLAELLNTYPLSILLSKFDKSELSKKFGVINININNFTQKAHYFKDNGVAVKMDKNWDWENVRAVASEAANAALVIDNYIFKGDIRSNFVKLLDIILPETLDIEFHLTIFYIDSRIDSIQSLKETIRKIRPNLNIKYEFIQHRGDANNGFKTDFHDRTILTNNLWIGSGAGFNILKRDRLHFESQKTTTIPIAHVFFASKSIQWLDDAVNNLIEDAKNTLYKKHISSTNRLLDSSASA